MYPTWQEVCFVAKLYNLQVLKRSDTVHRPVDDPRKECEECGNARSLLSNVKTFSPQRLLITD
jgi:hypothetical protein